MRKFLLNQYLSCYHFIASERIIRKDVPEKYIHAHLVCVLSTGVLMWAYALVAMFTIESPIPGLVGIVASSIHLFSPLLYWKNNNYFFNANVFLAAGLVHQMTFAYFTGGFDSNILIWLGILPMLGGVVAGRKAAILWAFITTFCVLSFLLLKLNGFQFPYEISPSGQLLAQSLILFGWIFISTSVIWVHILLVEQNDEKLIKSRERTQNIINILNHDISTPLTVLNIKLKELNKSSLTDAQKILMAKIFNSSERIVEVTESVRELRLNELGKREIKLVNIDVRKLILELKENFAEKLEQKKIKLNWSVASEVYFLYSSRSLILHQILGNLLSNAIKFSDTGSDIRLRVSRVGTHAQILIEDSGVGIPKEIRENLFEASLTQSHLGTLGEVGSGFGLPIVKNCIERLGGDISFETKTNLEGPSGTTFKLLFPIH